ncbi:MAG: hypothetical protein AUJ39_00800 [Parcubacteria group bacterium CG1_02_42_13]|nr:MAG: hypothetical protein AUJ39_00800 [Parcubacteria group bacterium CG1_02_42_13]
MVNDTNIKKVLVVCDSVYQTKANNRKGGVGTETQLISKEVYESAGQEKFIPIIREYDESGKPCIPHYMASRIYIDLSSDEKFEESYQKLIRNLYDKPLLKRPALGMPPAYITEEEQVVLRTSHKVAEIKNAILNDRSSANGLISDYLDTFIASLEDFRLSGGSAPDFDNYRFFSYELALYLLAVLIKLKKYDELAYFINNQYFYRSPNTSELAHNGIEIFNHYLPSLDEIRNKRLELRRVSVTADLIKSRATRKDIDFSDLIQADLVAFYITELRGGHFGWFPRTSVYNSRWGSGVEIFDRLVSRQHFEKTKILFGIKTIDELKKLIEQYIERSQEEIKQGHRRSWSWDYEIQPLEKVIERDKIGTVQ